MDNNKIYPLTKIPPSSALSNSCPTHSTLGCTPIATTIICVYILSPFERRKFKCLLPYYEESEYPP